ncbi:MAG: winged helix-turn-helix transcriptional regulator [Candidatus Marinimicrobia bacterium]|nr:winged helix-turn-helix transcriptional regulator [Candidatus Neomarinimicrobiota bacterium]
MIEEFVATKISKLFHVLSNEVRINIIYSLMENESLTVTELSEKLSIPQNTLSSHLKLLYEGSYIDKEQNWRNVNYSVRENKLYELFEIALSILDDKWKGNWDKLNSAIRELDKIANGNNKK